MDNLLILNMHDHHYITQMGEIQSYSKIKE